MLGAGQVVGIDIRTDEQKFSNLVRELSPNGNVSCHVMNMECTDFKDSSFDRIITLSSFEHFRNPFKILQECHRVLKSGGKVYLTSGVWSSPWGAHMHFFTKAPWIQFFFSEKTIMNVRKLYRSDGANKFNEVEGCLNGIGIGKFLKYVEQTNFELEYLLLNPVKGLTFLTKIPYINEFFTNLIHAVLRKN